MAARMGGGGARAWGGDGGIGMRRRVLGRCSPVIYVCERGRERRKTDIARACGHEWERKRGSWRRWVPFS